MATKLLHTFIASHNTRGGHGEKPPHPSYLPYVIVALLFVLGLVVLSYPAISNWYNAQFHKDALISYDEEIKNASEQSLEKELQKARDYNAALTGADIVDPFIPGGMGELPPNYLNILDVNNGMMASITIPKIEVNLPIFHGTNQSVLEKGVGHMEMTAFPIGGSGNHTVLTGHTGLPSATLFSHLNELAVGDEFFIKIQKQTLGYRIVSTLVIEPGDTKSLIPVSDKDYISLVTCTPYGVNSHRLVVRGERVPLDETSYDEQGFGHAAQDSWVGMLTLGALGCALVIFAFVAIRKKAS